MKAIGCFIFGGSATLGVEAANINVDKVLEMTDDMKELNSYHFVKNRPDIPIILPKEWENDEYLESLSKENYDLLYSNCPCSSLSQINRNAKVDGANNVHFYRVFNVVRKVQPKAFFIENAPTLVKLGYPILKDMTHQLNDLYKFTIIRDFAGNHGVGMRRMRTLVVGWRKDLFDGKFPLLQMNHEKQITTKDVIGDLYKYSVGDPNVNNHDLINNTTWSPVEHLFNYVPNETTTLLAFINKWNELNNQVTHPSCRNEVLKAINKLNKDERLWDKSPFRVSENSYCPSLTSVSKLIHPVHNRSFTIREYARLMGYPDSFKFYPNECKTPVITCICQGVPKNFIKYIASEVKAALEGNRPLADDTEDKVLLFQHHTHKVWKAYDQNEIDQLTQLDQEKGQQYFKLEK